jgi:hypothetical protein
MLQIVKGKFPSSDYLKTSSKFINEARKIHKASSIFLDYFQRLDSHELTLLGDNFFREIFLK